MSTPTKNSVPFTDNLSPFGLGDLGSLIEGVKWGGGGYGTGVLLTYSFPTGQAHWILPYSSDGSEGEWSDWYGLSGAEREGVRSGLAAWSSLTNVYFVEVADNASVVGDLRFTISGTLDDNANATGAYPHDHPRGGDIWFNADSWHTESEESVALGSYDYYTILHEIGHALGLKHPFEGSPALPKQYDSYSYTVMSYSVRPDDEGWANFYPTTPMWFDILAIQQLYGVRAHNEGDTTYSYSSAKHYWETIDDTGGNDTIKVGGSADAVINLNGQWSKIGKPIKFNHGKQAETSPSVPTR